MAEASTYHVLNTSHDSVTLKWSPNMVVEKMTLRAVGVALDQLYSVNDDSKLIPEKNRTEYIYFNEFIMIPDLSPYTRYNICFYPIPMHWRPYSEDDCYYKETFDTAEGGKSKLYCCSRDQRNLSVAVFQNWLD